MIIVVGFKVDNERAIRFRKWANQIVILGYDYLLEILQKELITYQYFDIICI